jgi:hypothetical protein
VTSSQGFVRETGEAARHAVDRLETAVAHEAHEYAPRDARPLREYAVFMGAYGAAVAGLAIAGRGRRDSLPQRIGLGDIALLGVASHRLSRLISRDSITSVVRAPFTRYVEPAGAGELKEEVRGSGLRHAFGELIGCPFCLTQWISTGFVAGLVFAPRATRLAATVLTVVDVSNALQFGYAALRRAAE